MDPLFEQEELAFWAGCVAVKLFAGPTPGPPEVDAAVKTAVACALEASHAFSAAKSTAFWAGAGGGTTFFAEKIIAPSGA